MILSCLKRACAVVLFTGLSSCCAAQQKPDKATRADKRALSARYYNLAVSYWNQGNWDKAIEYLEKYVEMAEELFGNKHKNVLEGYEDLAQAYWRRKDYEAAIKCFEKVAKIQGKILNIDKSKFTITYTYVQLGEVCKQQGNLDKAIKYWEEALRLGGKEANGYGTYEDLAYAYYNRKNYVKAEQYFEETVEIQEKGWGRENKDALITYHNLGCALQQQAKYKQAKKYYQKVLNSLQQTGPWPELENQCRENLKRAEQQNKECELFISSNTLD